MERATMINYNDIKNTSKQHSIRFSGKLKYTVVGPDKLYHVNPLLATGLVRMKAKIEAAYCMRHRVVG